MTQRGRGWARLGGRLDGHSGMDPLPSQLAWPIVDAQVPPNFLARVWLGSRGEHELDECGISQ